MLKKVVLFSFLFSSLQAMPCSTLSYEHGNGNPWVIKSFDFSEGNGHVFINKKNISKKSLTFSLGSGKKWVSQYGSVTFNQVGRDFPFGGMNEAGLNMEIMWLDETKYPKEAKVSDQVNESQLIQYVLDTASTTEEAIDKIQNISLVPILAPVHYMICDTSEACVVIEYLHGELVVTPIKNQREKILQNSIYGDMLFQKLVPQGRTMRNTRSDLDFIFNNSNAVTEEDFVRKSFENLDRLAQPNWSRWQIVYNLQTKKVWFRTILVPKIKMLSLNDYELDCQVDSEEKIINIDSPVSGDVKNHLISFTEDINTEMLNAFKSVPVFIRKIGNIYTSINHTCVKK